MAIAEQVLSVTVAADGTATATVSPDSRFQAWTVSQVSVEMPTAPIGATCVMRKDGTLITPIIPTGDAAAGEPSIPLRQGQQLTVTFAGCTPGDTGTVYVLYDDGLEVAS